MSGHRDGGLVRNIHLQGRDVTLVDHTGGADPESIAAVLHSVGERFGGRRCLAVLGAMQGLTVQGTHNHREVVAAIVGAQPDGVYTLGPALVDLWMELPPQIHSAHLSSTAQLRAVIEHDCRDGDVLVLHGSPGSGLRRFGRELRAASTRATGEESWHLLISGHRVHGVGFRRWLAKRAIRHGVTGWVRNRTDRTVEAVLTGPGPAVDAVLVQAHTGPRRARVRRVVSRRRTSTDGPAGFEIRADRTV